MSAPAAGKTALKVAFATLGCKVNQYDTATMETALRGGGEIVPFAPGADVYVVNTCTVTDRAAAESRQLARRARRFNPAGRVVVTGCHAQTSGAALAALSEVDHVIGVGRLGDVLRAVRGEIDAGERLLVDDLRRATGVSTLGAEVFAGQTRAFLKIQEGCDLFCTFCIVPFSRGRSRSVAPRRVLAELERLGTAGYREVVLTGIHLGGYGQDLSPALGLVDLLEMIAEATDVPRLRLSSVDPPEVTPRLLEVMARSARLCPHLHVPVQSGADGVLRRMRRRYDAQLVRDVAGEIRRRLPDAALGTDVIAGFPGESEADFAAGRALLEELPFTYVHVFPYSARTGTTAAKAGDRLPQATVERRAAALRALGEDKRRAFAERFVGAEVEVLVESRRDRASGLLAGYSRNYLRVLFPGGDGAMNREMRVRAAERIGDRLLGLPVGEVAGVGSGPA
jgi:threonylcarbamoyladenosine tRNA methylthiotransferase MtaB